MQYSFPIAPQTYFTIRNKAHAREKFLRDSSVEPDFVYPKMLNIRTIEQRVVSVNNDDLDAVYRLDLVLASAKLLDKPSSHQLVRFREANQQLYGTPSRGYAVFILDRIDGNRKPDHAKLWQYIDNRLGDFVHDEAHPKHPSRELFLRLKSYLDEYTDGGLDDDSKSLFEMIVANLDRSGLSSSGWSAELVSDHSHARTLQGTKTIYVGKSFHPRTDTSKRQITAHEVYGHAMRGYHGDIELSEGFATFLEQLALKKFSMKRSFRYLAVALGWGVTGSPMKFSEVYELIWRLMVVMGRYDEARAKRHAFDECARAFRGGRPDMPGAVFLKDSLYFSGNMRVWRYFMNNDVSYEDFVDIIEGRKHPI